MTMRGLAGKLAILWLCLGSGLAGAGNNGGEDYFHILSKDLPTGGFDRGKLCERIAGIEIAEAFPAPHFKIIPNVEYKKRVRYIKKVILRLEHRATSEVLMQALVAGGGGVEAHENILSEVSRRRDELLHGYSKADYKVVIRPYYGVKNESVGELDFVIVELETKRVVKVVEVKCWRNLKRARVVANKQLRRFKDEMEHFAEHGLEFSPELISSTAAIDRGNEIGEESEDVTILKVLPVIAEPNLAVTDPDKLWEFRLDQFREKFEFLILTQAAKTGRTPLECGPYPLTGGREETCTATFSLNLDQVERLGVRLGAKRCNTKKLDPPPRAYRRTQQKSAASVCKGKINRRAV